VATDLLFPSISSATWPAFLSASGGDVQFEALRSIQGHGFFVLDVEWFAPRIGSFLGRLLRG
jgi:homoserine acetyltransferase